MGWEILARTDLFHLLRAARLVNENYNYVSVFCIYTHTHTQTHYRSFVYTYAFTDTRTFEFPVPRRKNYYTQSHSQWKFITIEVFLSRRCLSFGRTHTEFSADRHDTTTVSLGRKYETEWCAPLGGALAPPNENNAHWSSVCLMSIYICLVYMVKWVHGWWLW